MTHVSMTVLFQDNFDLLSRLFDDNLREIPEAGKSEVSGYMALHFDKLSARGAIAEIALAHYFYVNHDSVPDPDMVLRVDFVARTVEAFSYQDSFGYRTVYADSGDRDEREYRSQNQFLGTWLRNCLAQGHKFKRPDASL